MTKTFDKSKAIKAQSEFCSGSFHFAPRSGICPYCNRNIYEPWTHKWYNGIREIEVTTGYSVEYASKNRITGCPHCKHTYCD